MNSPRLWSRHKEESIQKKPRNKDRIDYKIVRERGCSRVVVVLVVARIFNDMGNVIFPCCCGAQQTSNSSKEELTEEERERRRNLQAEAARKRQNASGVRRDKKKAKKAIDPSKVGMNKSDWN